MESQRIIARCGRHVCGMQDYATCLNTADNLWKRGGYPANRRCFSRVWGLPGSSVRSHRETEISECPNRKSVVRPCGTWAVVKRGFVVVLVCFWDCGMLVSPVCCSLLRALSPDLWSERGRGQGQGQHAVFEPVYDCGRAPS